MIKDLLRGDLVTAFSDASIQEIALLMDERSVGLVVITDRYSSGKPIGLITDRDIVINFVKNNRDASLEKVACIMNTYLVTASESVTISDAIKIMEVHHIRRLVVVDEKEVAVGIVSIDDLIALLGTEINRLGNICRSQAGSESRHRGHDFTKMA